ncbi:MAG: thiol:disulfide interchange protein DsbA/DsbL [Pseudomonadota bacterium]
MRYSTFKPSTYFFVAVTASGPNSDALARALRRVSAGLVTLAVLVMCLGAVQVRAQEEVPVFVEGEHYKRLPISVDTEDPAKVEVVEVFSYMCVHCYNFDPFIEAWHDMQGEGVSFRRLPASFNADWELLAQAFYTAETLGVTEQVHEAIFSGLHNDRRDLRKSAELAALFADQAQVAEDDFLTAYNSFSVRSRVQQAKAVTRAYQVTGVPTLVVNGKYVVDGRMAGGNVAMLQVVDQLIREEQAAASSVSQLPVVAE